ncbi:hypothetical protein C360_04744 [Cryptococcus neoformans Bt15]|nr:hypothetical protein C360_04744 [Cryptococcus neoformans var. grubii Bt15]
MWHQPLLTTPDGGRLRTTQASGLSTKTPSNGTFHSLGTIQPDHALVEMNEWDITSGILASQLMLVIFSLRMDSHLNIEGTFYQEFARGLFQQIRAEEAETLEEARLRYKVFLVF